MLCTCIKPVVEFMPSIKHVWACIKHVMHMHHSCCMHACCIHISNMYDVASILACCMHIYACYNACFKHGISILLWLLHACNMHVTCIESMCPKTPHVTWNLNLSWVHNQFCNSIYCHNTLYLLDACYNGACVLSRIASIEIIGLHMPKALQTPVKFFLKSMGWW